MLFFEEKASIVNNTENESILFFIKYARVTVSLRQAESHLCSVEGGGVGDVNNVLKLLKNRGFSFEIYGPDSLRRERAEFLIYGKKLQTKLTFYGHCI